MNGAPSEPGGRLLSGPAAYRPATPWRAGPALLATFVIVAAGILAAMLLPAFVGLDALSGGTGGTGAPGHPGARMLADRLWALAILQVVAVALTLGAARLLGGRVGDVLALRAAPAGWRVYAGAILALAALQAVLAVAQSLLADHDMLADLRPFAGLVDSPYWPLAAAVLGLGAPLSEELLFRGFLLGALAQSRLGFAGAALVSTLAWTALHYGYTAIGLAEVFAIGLLMSWLLWRTGSLRVTILCHALYNSAIVLALRLVDLPASV